MDGARKLSKEQRDKYIRDIETEFGFQVTLEKIGTEDGVDKNLCPLIKRDLADDYVLLDIWRTKKREVYTVGVTTTDLAGQPMTPDRKPKYSFEEAQGVYNKLLQPQKDSNQQLLQRLTIGRKQKYEKVLGKLGLL